MDANKFTQVMANAQRLMLDEGFNRAVEAKANSFSGRKGGNDIDFASMESQAFGYTNESIERPVQMIQTPTVNTTKNLDKLPEALRESFAKMPPMSGEGMPDGTRMGAMEAALSLKEAVMPQSTYIPTQQQHSGNGIDYSLIKTIIDESVRKNISEILSKGMLNESNNLRGLKLGKGNKIQLLDNAGNLYEATLTLKKKAQK